MKNGNILFGFNLNSIKDFETFATSHYAYDEDGEIHWAPGNMCDFIAFMQKYYDNDLDAQSNFVEGAEDWAKNQSEAEISKVYGLLREAQDLILEHGDFEDEHISETRKAIKKAICEIIESNQMNG